MKVIELSGPGKNGELLLVFDGFGGSIPRSRAVSGLVPEEGALWYVYDYTDEDFPLEKLREYKNVHLAAWSLGVWQAARTLRRTELKSACAFNGTLDPVSSEYGIAPEIFHATAENWSEAARRKFNRRAGIPGEFSSDRPAEAEKLELLALEMRIAAPGDAPKNIYRQVFAGENDRIFPLENQLRFWRKCPLDPVVLTAPHYIWNLAAKAADNE
ncbi:MAG: DUF452 family protein [Victivallaceae bacterium]|nr:DUF452 family protein [Victivallaceae bacterium]